MTRIFIFGIMLALGAAIVKPEWEPITLADLYAYSQFGWRQIVYFLFGFAVLVVMMFSSFLAEDEQDVMNFKKYHPALRIAVAITASAFLVWLNTPSEAKLIRQAKSYPLACINKSTGQHAISPARVWRVEKNGIVVNDKLHFTAEQCALLPKSVVASYKPPVPLPPE